MKGSFKRLLLAIICLATAYSQVSAQCTSEGSFNFSRNAALGQSANNKTLKQNGVTLTITSRVLPTSTASLTALMFNDSHKPTGDTFTVHNQMNVGASGDAGLLVKFAFDKPLSSLHFEIYDVDGTSSKRDSIHVRGYNGASVINLAPANYTLGSLVVSNSTNQFRANSATGSGNDDPAGDVKINFPQPVDSITIVVSNGGTGGTAGAMSVSFGNIRWCNDPPLSTCASTRGDFVFAADATLANGDQITQDGVTLTISRTAFLGAPTFQTWAFNNAHKTAAIGMQAQQSVTGPGQVVKYKMAFDRRLQGLNMSIWDLEGGTNSDSVNILAYGDGIALTLDSSHFSYGRSMNNTPSGSRFKGLVHASNTNDRSGDLNISFPGNIDSVIILTTQAAGESGSYSFTVGGISWCNSLDAVPVFLKDFTGNMNNGLVNLNWNVTGDKTVEKMEIQRSVDGSNFATIASINGRTGFNNNYQYRDIPSNLSSSRIYYRILFITTEGQKSFSSVLPIRLIDNGGSVTIAPNPARNYAIIQYKSISKGTAQIRLADATGRVLIRTQHNSQPGNNTVTMNNLDRLPEGIYTVMIESEGQLLVQKLSLRK